MVCSIQWVIKHTKSQVCKTVDWNGKWRIFIRLKEVMRLVFLILTIAVTSFVWGQTNFSIQGEHFTNQKNLNSTGLIFNFELQLGSNSRWHLFYEHGVEINNNQLGHIRTSLPIAGAFKLLTLTPGSSDNNTFFMYVFYIPNGISYHLPHHKVNFFSFKAVPLGFSYWQMLNEKRINAMDLQIGVEYFLHLKKGQGLVFGVTNAYQVNLGRKMFAPPNYSNGFFTGIRIGYKWCSAD